MKVDIKQLGALMTLLTKHGFDEVEISKGDDTIRVSRNSAPAAQTAVPAPVVAGAAVAQTKAPDKEKVAEGDFITSPFVGTFYRAPKPGATPFVEAGSKVKPGKVLCIVEAMKLMNEIESDITGTIVEVLVEDGKAVEYGDQLFRVEKSK